MKLIINQPKTIEYIETVPASVIVKLYNLCNTPGALDPASSLTGRIKATNGYLSMANTIHAAFN